MIIGEVSIAPLGVGTSVSKYVKEAIKVIESSGLKNQTGGMSTTIEAPDLDTLFKVIKDAEEAEFRAGAQRVIIHLKVDDRRDKNATIESKVAAATGRT
jgi:uncharacterized protein (TIGR00106 family)